MNIEFEEAVALIAQGSAIQPRKAHRLLMNALAQGQIAADASHWCEGVSKQAGRYWIPLYPAPGFVAEGFQVPCWFWVKVCSHHCDSPGRYLNVQAEMPAGDLPFKWRASAVKKWGPTAWVRWSAETFRVYLVRDDVAQLIQDQDFIRKFDRAPAKKRGPKNGQLYPKVCAALRFLTLDRRVLLETEATTLAHLIAKQASADINDPSVKREILKFIASEKQSFFNPMDGDHAPG